MLEQDPVLKTAAAQLITLPVPLSRDQLFLAFQKSMNMRGWLDGFNVSLAKWKTSRGLVTRALAR
jgi:hypothetical protein